MKLPSHLIEKDLTKLLERTYQGCLDVQYEVRIAVKIVTTSELAQELFGLIDAMKLRRVIIDRETHVELWIYRYHHVLSVIRNQTEEPKGMFEYWVCLKLLGWGERAIEEYFCKLGEEE